MVEIVRACIVEKGFDECLSMETFDRRTRDEKVGPEECAKRAKRSWTRLEKALRGPENHF